MCGKLLIIKSMKYYLTNLAYTTFVSNYLLGKSHMGLATRKLYLYDPSARSIVSQQNCQITDIIQIKYVCPWIVHQKEKPKITRAESKQKNKYKTKKHKLSS